VGRFALEISPQLRDAAATLPPRFPPTQPLQIEASCWALEPPRLILSPDAVRDLGRISLTNCFGCSAIDFHSR
jgi:hypothetical protein